VNCFQFEVLDCLNCESGGSNQLGNIILYIGQCGMVSEQNLMFSGFVDNSPEIYLNVLLFIILKIIFSN
jgi:hypothetical protein